VTGRVRDLKTDSKDLLPALLSCNIEPVPSFSSSVDSAFLDSSVIEGDAFSPVDEFNGSLSSLGSALLAAPVVLPPVVVIPVVV
jgi:hypothetical protein